MADKKEKPEEGWNFDITEGAFLLLIVMTILSTIIPAIWNYITSGEITFYGYKLSGLFEFFKSNIQFFKAFGFVVAGVAAVSAIIYTKKGDHILREEKAKVYPDPNEMKISSSDSAPAKNPMAEKWKEIVRLSESENSSDWRLSIIEADIILDDLLHTLQLPGDTIGDKLKAVEKSDFTTIESAWEAHKARNMIAHEGSDFLINQHEIRRIISLYEAVFKEFFLI